MVPTVLVTGSTGHIGSWLVMRLLEKGYNVRAAVIDREDKEDLAPLLGLPDSLREQLEIVQADLRVDGGFDEAVKGCDGVFHLACPTNFDVEDPERDTINPSVQGTLRLLKACKASPSVKRIVHASSVAAVRFSGPDQPGYVFTEASWTDPNYCKQNNLPGWPYFVAKTLGEKAAVDFAEKNSLDVVVINPVMVNGPFLLSRIPNSIKDSLAIITGELFKMPFLQRMSYVHTEDIVRAFIFLYENPSLKGRFICSAVDSNIEEVVDIISTNYPEYKLPDLSFLGEPSIHYFDSAKLRNTGFQFKYTLKDIFVDAIKCCKEKGLLP